MCYMGPTIMHVEWSMNAFFLRLRAISKAMPLSHTGHQLPWVWVWRPEADVRCFLLLLSTLGFEMGSLTKPNTHGLARLAG